MHSSRLDVISRILQEGNILEQSINFKFRLNIILDPAPFQDIDPGSYNLTIITDKLNGLQGLQYYRSVN